MIHKHSGQLTAKLLEKEFGNKYVVHYAITRLTKEGKIKRVRGFGANRIEFFYLDIQLSLLSLQSLEICHLHVFYL